MNKRLVRYGILVMVCIITYLFIFNYTNQINNISNNTYEKTAVYTSKKMEFVKQYIENLKNNKYAEGFSMLSANAKVKFNNDLNKYTEYIKEKTIKMNRETDGTFANFVSGTSFKSGNVTKYELISKRYVYWVSRQIVIEKEFTVFNEFSVIEYSPNEFVISLI